jgi:hypothetical protein
MQAQSLAQFVNNHQILVSTVGTWIFNNIVTSLISSLPAPTKDSSGKYVYWFKVLNSICGNVKRAQSTALESSPNWPDALHAHVAQMVANGQIPTNSPEVK